MAPQTRSRVSDGAGRVSYHEPPPPSPPARTSAPKTKITRKPKVYRRADPAPQQVHFPARKTTIRTYGKSRRSLPSKTPDQSTLTQFGWIPSTFQEEDEEDDIDRYNDPTTLGDEDDDWKTEEKKRRSKRRRTTGDIVPDSTASSSYHTQTLTQMPSFLSGQQPEDDELQGNFDFNTDEDTNDPAEAAVDDEIYEATPVKTRKDPTSSARKGESRSSLPPQSPVGSIVAQTQTPRKQTVDKAVIPSSQPSPFTPNLGIAHRYWTNLDRTPLKGKSTNVDAPTPTATGKRPRTLEIADSWSTVNGGMGSSPLKETQRVQRTPLKEIYLDGMADVSMELGEAPASDNLSDGQEDLVEDGVTTRVEEAGAATPQKSTRPAEEIILDSDDDFGFESEDENPDDEEAPGTPTPIHRVPGPATEVVIPEKTGAPMPPAPKAATQSSSHYVTKSNPTPEPPVESDEVEPETPSPSPQRRPSMSSAVEVERETPLSSPQKTSPALPPVSQLGSGHRSRVLSSPQKTSAAIPPVSQLGYRYKSQAFESQRVPFEKIRQLGPQTDRSDVILSIHPEQADQIAEGEKTHEFRNYRIPQTVGRVWIYVTRPVCALMYMAPISAAKQPGEILPGDDGVGNDDFNEGAGTEFAYELKQVYELNNPVSLARMKENGWVEEAPAKYVYVPPAVLGELLGNLRCALFKEPGESQSSQVDMSVSQEVAMQLRSDVAHSTQLDMDGSSQLRLGLLGDDKDNEGVVSSSQAEAEEHGNKPVRGAPVSDEVVFAKPTIPTSRSQRGVHWVGESPVARRSQRSQQCQRAANSTSRPSQATTASATSSPSQQLPPQRPPQTRSQESIPLSPPTKSVRRPELIESSSMTSNPEDMVIVGDSPVRPRGGAETQTSLLLGSSQGFALGEQDSLLDDSRVRQPPDVVWDSEGEID